MAENSKIEWTHHTFNPWIGCMKVGPGCDHCYAEALMDVRRGKAKWGAGQQRVRTAPSTWKQPLAWNRKAAAAGIRQRVFCASLADVFDNEVDPQWRDDLWRLIIDTPNLDWLILTKRIGNVGCRTPIKGLPDNVWLGATIVNQLEADRDIPKLLATPAAKRFLSMEPLLGPVDLTDHCNGWHFQNFLTGERWHDPPPGQHGAFDHGGGRIDWVIVGGESGHGARPMHPDWARSLRDQCAAAGVPFLFKQWGQWVNEAQSPDDAIFPGEGYDPFAQGEYWAKLGKKLAGRLLDGVQHDGMPA